MDTKAILTTGYVSLLGLHMLESDHYNTARTEESKQIERTLKTGEYTQLTVTTVARILAIPLKCNGKCKWSYRPFLSCGFF